MQAADHVRQHGEFLPGRQERSDALLHLIEAMDIEFLEMHRLSPGIPHDQHHEAIAGQQVSRQFSSSGILVGTEYKIVMDEIFTEPRFGFNDSGNIPQYMTMAFLKSRSNKQAVNPGYSFLVSEHTVIIYRNQIFHSGFHLS